MKKKFDIGIIGGGVAGLSAVMYAGRFNLKAIVFEPFLGGTIAKAGNIENYPGFKSITGQALSDNIKNQALSQKPEIISEYVDSIEKKKDLFIIKSPKGTFQAKVVIFATGRDWKKLGIKGEKEFTNKGVHYCALCDGPFYKNKIVAVAGAGDSAVKEAIILSGMAKKVYIIARGDDVHPEPITYSHMKKAKNIELINKCEVVEIMGDKKLEKLKLSREYNKSGLLEVNALFVDIGHIPMAQLAKELGVKLNEKTEIITDKSAQTNIKGVFAAGDITDTPFKQAITSASEGCTAAYAAYKYLGS